MVETFDIKVKVKEDLKKGLIFNFRSRLPIGIVLAFFGYRHEVMPLLQTLSHGSRAFIWNADGLRGFVLEIPILKVLKEAVENG